jgi:D-alanyl-D-alanine carboxypeptidase
MHRMADAHCAPPPPPASRARSAVAGLVLAVAAALLLLTPAPARAQIGSDRYAAIVVDAATGRVLFAHDADAPRHPASLTKMMTAYMVFEAVRSNRTRWSTRVVMSAHAAARPPSKLGLPVGTHITLQQALLAIVTRSANDAAAAIAETLGGTEANFARLMTQRARQLGMRSTVFRNASGLPDADQITTARDMATLGIRLLRDFPNEYRYFATEQFRLRGRVHRNHNRLLAAYDGADGIKTGYIRASGFNLVASATRDGRRLVGVVLGGASAAERDRHMAELLDQGFAGSEIRTASAGPPIRLVSRAVAAPSQQTEAADWTVQVGAFRDRGGALAAARAAARRFGTGTVQVEQARVRNRTVWRARVAGLSEAQARKACSEQQRRRQACATIAPVAGRSPTRGTVQLASAAAAVPASRDWAARLGAYRDRGGALAAARSAARKVGTGTVTVEREQRRGRMVWTSSLAGLSETQARKVCAGRRHCAPVEPESGAAVAARTPAVARDWVVRLGVYRDRAGALAAAKRATRATAASAPEPKLTRTRYAGRPAWRAELVNLTGAEARRTCAAWPSRGPDCVTVSPTALAEASSTRG